MKKEIKIPNSNAKRNSLLLFNRHVNFFSNQGLNRENQIEKKTPIRIEEKENIISNILNDKKNISYKKMIKENNFYSKIKNVLSKNESNSKISNNKSNITQKPTFSTRSHSKNKNFIESKNKRNLIKDFDNEMNYIPNTNTEEDIFFHTESDDFNTLDNINDSYEVYNKNKQLKIKGNKNIIRIDLNKPKINIFDLDENFQTIEIEKNGHNCNSLEDLTILNKIDYNDKNLVYHKENLIQINSKPNKNINNILNFNNSFEHKSKKLNNNFDEKEKTFNNIKDNNNNNVKKNNISYSLIKNSITKNKINIEKNSNYIKIKSVNYNNCLIHKKKKEISSISKLTIGKISDINKSLKSNIKLNLDSILFNSNNNYNYCNNPTERIDTNLTKKILKDIKVLKNSKSQNADFLKANLCLSNHKPIFNKKIDISEDYNKGNRSITNVEANNNIYYKDNSLDINYENYTSSSKILENRYSKDLNLNKSKNYLIINSNKSSYTEGFNSIIDKFKNYLNRIISFIHDNNQLVDDSSIIKNSSLFFLNATYESKKIDFNDLIKNHCKISKTELSNITVTTIKNFFENFEKKITFEIEDLLLGISTILLDCNIIRQNFMESYPKMSRNVKFFNLQNEDLIRENIEQIDKSSERRIKNFLSIFQDMKQNLNEIEDLLLNKFGNNLVSILKETKNQDFLEVLINNIKNTEKTNPKISSNLNKIEEIEKDNKKDHFIQTKDNLKVIEIDLSYDNNKIEKIYEIIKDKRSNYGNFDKKDNFEMKKLKIVNKEFTKYRNIDDYKKILKRKNLIIDNHKAEELISNKSEIKNKISKNDNINISFNDIDKNSTKINVKESPKNKKYFKKNDYFIRGKTPKSQFIDLKNKNNKNKKNSPIKTTRKNLEILSIIPNKMKLIESHIINKENNQKLINNNNKKYINLDFNSEFNPRIDLNKIMDNPSDKKLIEKDDNLIIKKNTTANDFNEYIKTDNLDFMLNSEQINNILENIKNLSNGKDEDHKNFINNSNYININVNINQLSTNSNLNEKISKEKINSSFNTNTSKSENNKTDIDLILRLNRKSSINNTKEKFAFGKFSQLANQTKSNFDSKIKNIKDSFEKKISISNLSQEESELMASIDEFDSNEKVHIDIPLSSINYAHMPICGSKIVRRHSSFSKVLENFNYKRFFNFSRNPSISSVNKKKNKNYKKIKYNKIISDDIINNINIEKEKNDLNKKNTESIKTPELKSFNLKKIELKNCEKYSDMNSSAPELSISFSEVCNDTFKCYNNIEIRERFGMYNYNGKIN